MVRMERSRRDRWNVNVKLGGPEGASGWSRAVGAATRGTQGLAGACPHPPAFDTR
jgi:hypothetical protein